MANQNAPVRINTKNAAARDTEPLFYIDDEEFRIPVQVPPNMALAFIRDMRGGNTEQAIAKALDNLLGEKAVDRLADCEALEQEQLNQIMGVIERKMMAAAEQLQGN